MKKTVMVFTFALVIAAILPVSSFAGLEDGDVIDHRPYLGSTYNASYATTSYNSSTFIYNHSWKNPAQADFAYHYLNSAIFPNVVVGNTYLIRISGKLNNHPVAKIFFRGNGTEFDSDAHPQYFVIDGNDFHINFEYVASNVSYGFLNYIRVYTTTSNVSYSIAYSEASIQSLSAAPQSYTITPSAGQGGSISPATAQSVLKGESKSFNIIPDTGYRIKDVLVGGASVGAVSSYTFENVQSDSTIAAEFELIPPTYYAITPSAGQGGSISPATAQSVLKGESKSFNIIPDTGYRIKDVLVGGASVGAVSSYTFEDVQSDSTIAAEFELIPPTHYIITPSAGQGGSISPATVQSVIEGESKSFNIIPDTGYRIKDVLVGGASVGAVSSYTFENVQSDSTIAAEFEPLPLVTYITYASAGAGGNISPSGEIIIPQGGSQTFNIIPDIGYRISDVLVDGASVGAVSSYTFRDVRSHYDISASFDLVSSSPYIPWDVTVFTQGMLNLRSSIGTAFNIAFRIFILISGVHLVIKIVGAVGK